MLISTMLISTMRILSLVAFSFAATHAFLGCSGAFCERQSKCSAQPKVDTKMCTDDLLKSGNCQKQQEAWKNCQYDHEVCTMDNRHDDTATIGYALSACKSQKKDLDTCITTDGGVP